MRLSAFIPFLFLSSFALAQPAPVNSASGSTGAGTSVTLTFGAGVTPGDSIAIGTGQSYSSGNPIITSATDSMGDFVQVWGCQHQLNNRGGCVLTVSNTAGGTCSPTCPTVTINFSGSAAITAAAEEYSGAPAHAVEFVSPPTIVSSNPSLTVGPVYTQTSNTRLVAFGWSALGAATTFTASGFTFRAGASESTVGSALELLDAPEAAINNTSGYSATINGITNNIQMGMLLALRSVEPSVGIVSVSYSGSTSASSLVCPIETGTNGDTLTVEISATFNTDNNPIQYMLTPSITGGSGDVIGALPLSSRGADGDHFLYQIKNISGGETAFNLSSPGGAQGLDCLVTEAKGLANTHPYWGSTYFSANSGSPLTTSTLLTQSGLTHLLYSSAYDETVGSSYTANSGFVPRWINFQQNNAPIPNFIKEVWEQIVSGSGTYSNSITASTGNFGSASDVFLLDLGTANNSAAHPVQAQQAGGSSGSTAAQAETSVPVTVGNTLLLYSTWGAPSTPVITESLGNTAIRLCGSTSDFYGLWKFPIATGGQDTVEVNPSQNTSMTLLEVTGIGNVSANCAENPSASTITPSAISPINANSYVVSFAGTASTCGSVPGLIYPVVNYWVDRIGSGGHCANTGMEDYFPGALGSYSLTWTTPSNTQISSAIASFLPVIGLTPLTFKGTGTLLKGTGTAK